MEFDDLVTFSDESSTGRSGDAFRGLGRATIAARAEDRNGFEWLSRLRRDHLPNNVEPKSAVVLPIMEANQAARAAVLENIGSTTIVVIDLGESYRALLTDVSQKLGKKRQYSLRV